MSSSGLVNDQWPCLTVFKGICVYHWGKWVSFCRQSYSTWSAILNLLGETGRPYIFYPIAGDGLTAHEGRASAVIVLTQFSYSIMESVFKWLMNTPKYKHIQCDPQPRSEMFHDEIIIQIIQHKTITWINADVLSIGPLRTKLQWNLSQNFIMSV